MSPMTVAVHSSSKAPGGAAGEIFAKLEVYLWFGLAKYSKEVIGCLPEEFLPVYEDEEEHEEGQRMKKLPVSLSCQGELAASK